MNKKILAVIIIALVLIIGIIITNNTKNNETTTEPKVEIVETSLAEKKTNGTFEIYNTDINTSNGSTKITATIKNVSKTKTLEQIIEIVLLDKNNNELGTIKASIPSLNSGIATEISAESLKVYQNIYDYKVK